MKEKAKKLVTKYRAFEIKLPYSEAVKALGFWRVFWGTDIFINNIPVLKFMSLVNFFVWLVMWLTLQHST